MGLLSSIGKAITKTLDTVSGVVTNPITAITKGTDASTKKFIEAKPLTNVTKTVLNVGTAIGVVSGVGAVTGLTRAGTVGATVSKAVGTVAKSLIPTTGKGIIVASVAVPAAAAAFIKSPEKISDAVASLPQKGYDFGEDVGKFIDSPSLETGLDIVKENKLVSGLLAGAVALPLLPAAANLITNLKQNSDINKLEEKFTSLPTQLVQVPSVNKIIDSSQSVPMQPVTPQTQSISKGTTTKRRKKAKKTVMPTSINQKVNVIVSNRSSSIGIKSSKKYINEAFLAR